MECFMIFLAVIIVMAVLGFVGYYIEKYQWNDGICRDNGKPWIRFDTDSQGGRGYEAGGRYCWISWPVDKTRHPNHPQRKENKG